MKVAIKTGGAKTKTEAIQAASKYGMFESISQHLSKNLEEVEKKKIEELMAQLEKGQDK